MWHSLVISVVSLAVFSPTLSQGPNIARTPAEIFTQSTTFVFTITGTPSDSTYSSFGCQVDNGGKFPCPTGSFTQSQQLTEGQHSFTAYFYNPTTKSYGPLFTTIKWTIDLTPPQLQFITNIDGTKKKDNKLTISYRVNSGENIGTYACVLMRLTAPKVNSTITCTGAGTTAGNATLDNLVTAGQDIEYKFVVTATDKALNKATKSMTFNIDNKLPVVKMPILGAPALPDRYTQANQSTFTVEVDETDVTFTCQLNSGTHVDCFGPTDDRQVYGSDQNPQAEGDYRFSLVAMDEAGNEQKQFLVKNADGTEAAQTSYVWTVDRTPPNRPDITMQPRSPSSDPNPQFKFSPPVHEKGGVTYLCEIKRPSSSFAMFPCTADTSVASPTSPVPGAINGKLDTGPHTLRSRMKDAAGNIGIYNEFTWIIDLIPPVIYNDTNFATSPDTLTKSPDKTFRFYSSDDYVYQTGMLHNTFEKRNRKPCPAPFCVHECRLDANPWSSCGSPTSLTDVVDKGHREIHTFYVRAVDQAGNEGMPTQFTWEIDRVDVTVIWIRQPDVIDNHESEIFVWATTERYVDEPPTFMCEVDVSGAKPCGLNYDSSGQYNFTATGLSHGHHDFYLTAIDYVGNVAPRVKYSWTTDLKPPAVIHSQVWGPEQFTNQQTVKFIISTEAHATLWCRLDAGNITVFAYEECSGRASAATNEVNTYVYNGLPDDDYTFFVISIDQGGNVSPNESYSFTVDTIGPVVAFAVRPNRFTNKLSAQFVLNSSEYLSTFECQYISDRYQDIKSLWLPCSVQPFFAVVIDPWNAVQFTVDQFKEESGNQIIYIDKPHEMKARATDRSGNTGPAASWIWEIDLIPPALNFSFSNNDVANGILDQNFRWVNNKTVVLDFAAFDSTYKCLIQRYDGQSKAFVNVTIVDCSPPYIFTNYSGLFRVKVIASDFFGNTGKISENGDGYVFGLVGNGPSSHIISYPEDVANTLDTKFTVNIPFPRAGANCSLRRLSPSVDMSSWQCVIANRNQRTYDIPGSQEIQFRISDHMGLVGGKYDGQYVFKYTVVDTWKNVSPEQRYKWSVDISPPETALHGTPPEFTKQRSVSFLFFADEQTIERFDCKLDTIVLDQSVQRQCVYGDTSKACSFSPCNFTYGYEGNTSYQNLKDGFYEFSVRAVDIAGNEDTSPTTVQFTVDAQPPHVSFLGSFPQVNISVKDEVLIYFKGDLGSQFYCRVTEQDNLLGSNPADYETCQSPYVVLPAPAVARSGSQFIVGVAAVDKAENVFATFTEVKQGSGSGYPSYNARIDDYNTTTLHHLPEVCDDHEDLFAAIAISGFALFAILAVIFPLIIMSRMASGSPSKMNRRSQRSDPGTAAFSRRPLEEDFY